MVVSPTLVPVTGVGRPDYSLEVARSVSATTINQVTANAGFNLLVPTVPYPLMYILTFFLSQPTGVIPQGYSLWGYKFTCTGDTNAPSVIGSQIYNHYDFVADVPSDLYETLFLKVAPHTAEVTASRGFDLKNYAGKWATLLFAHYSANPFTTIDVSIQGLFDVDLIKLTRAA